MNRFIQKIYHWILRFLFDYDVNVYSLKNKDIATHSILGHKYFRLRISNFLAQKPKVKRKKFKTKANVKNYIIIGTSIKLCNYPLNFLENLLLKDIWLDFFAICKNYLVHLRKKFSKITNEVIDFNPIIKKFARRDLILSKKVTTEKEIIEIEPYSNILPIDELIKIPVEKEPIEMSVFSKKQLETMREKLAMAAKCKKYSIKVENIYGDFFRSLYSNAEMQKDNKVIYKFKTEFEPQRENEDIFLFITGKKRYDANIHSVIVAYRDLGL